ncbi:hypothetical protein HYR99_34510 [Candidatus Poribacteria bacterium]|nr:hypothetical protein [Candidatus Poribacteria bacterium]
MKMKHFPLWILVALVVATSPVAAQNVVTDWSQIVQPAIHNPSAPRSIPHSFILHAMIHLAMYDAAMAIEGGYKPYAAAIMAPPGADVRAAVATAAYRTARARVAPSQYAYLDTQYTTYMSTIPAGKAKTDGAQVGEAAANAMIALRANDGFTNVVTYECSASPLPPGEFEPEGGCGTQPIGVNVSQIKPFTYSDPSQFRPDGPPPLTSKAYTEAFTEVRDYGRANSTVRTAEQTQIVYFWGTEHASPFNTRNLIALADSRGLNVRESARMLAMAWTAISDAGFAGFDAKYHFRHWRPRTAIPRADTDGNPDTAPDATWTPLLIVNHPEYPAGHSFGTTAIVEALIRYFGTDRVTWTIDNKSGASQLVVTQRTYENLNDIPGELADARVWGGLHWRYSTTDGEQIGREVAKHVTDLFFTAEDFSHVFFMSLSEGLNMISPPLKPQTPQTARAFAKELGATVVIQLDEKAQRFVGFTPDAPDDGFPIEEGKGYIVNLPQAKQVAFVGAPWTNQPPVEAAPPLAVGSLDSGWAFVVSGRIDAEQAPMDRDASTGSLFYVTVRNTRTCAIATDVVRSGYFAAAFADLTHNSVVSVGDRLEVTVRDSAGEMVSEPIPIQVTPDTLRQALARISIGNIGTPNQSQLLQNYPNPFNPETWIPYQLGFPAVVVIRIYDATGGLIRTLDVGPRAAGFYRERTRAAYWDGRNDTGERVSSGTYFYHFQAGDYRATGKMTILK